MLTKYYKQLQPQQQAFADQKIALRLQASTSLIRNILLSMNPVIDIANGKVILHKNTLFRIEKKVNKELKNNYQK